MVLMSWLNTCRWRVLVAASTGVLVGKAGGGSGVGVPSVSRDAGIWAATETPGTKSQARMAVATAVPDWPLVGVPGVAGAVAETLGVSETRGVCVAKTLGVWVDETPSV